MCATQTGQLHRQQREANVQLQTSNVVDAPRIRPGCGPPFGRTVRSRISKDVYTSTVSRFIGLSVVKEAHFVFVFFRAIYLLVLACRVYTSVESTSRVDWMIYWLVDCRTQYYIPLQSIE